jgi:hypothetical protein
MAIHSDFRDCNSVTAFLGDPGIQTASKSQPA